MIEGSISVEFDEDNDRVKITSTDSQFYKLPFVSSNTNFQNAWYRTGTNASLIPFSYGNQNNQSLIPLGEGHFQIQFGDDEENNLTKDFAQSAYLNKKVFGAIVKDQNKVVRAENTTLSDNLVSQKSSDTTGALITWETIDNPDEDFVQNALIPDLDYMSWGFWALATNDIADNLYNGLFDGQGEQTAAVHMGTWFAGDLLDVTDWPISRTATLAGMAMFDVFARIEESGVTNSYHWTEGAGASGSVVFDGSGDYQIDITVNNLGSGAHGSGFTSQMLNGAAGSITWSASGNSGSPNFSGEEISTSTFGSEIIKNQKNIWGELYGVKTHIEAGTILQFSRETNSEMIMYAGSAILSE